MPSKRAVPNGGRYTRPRRGFRAKSHYRERLAHRGMTPRDVRMPSIKPLRDKQGYVPNASIITNVKPANPKTRRSYTGVQMPRGMREKDSDNYVDLL